MLTLEVLNKYNKDYRVIVVGDAKLFGDAISTALPNALVIPIGDLDLDSPTLAKGP